MCCAMRSGSVLVPRSTSQESNGLRIAPAEFWMNFSHSMSSSRVAMTTPPIESLWPFRYFVVLCTTRSAPSAMRPLQARARERVVDDEHRAVRVRESRPRAAMSVRRSTGLVGVSMKHQLRAAA